MHAALMNGISSHVFDFDDTHLKTVIHPAGPVASAILALSEYQPVSGADFLHALVLGAEVECRIGNAVYPAHYDVGLAHHRDGRPVRRGGRRGQAARTFRSSRWCGRWASRPRSRWDCARCSAP